MTIQNVGYFKKARSKIKTLCFTHRIFQKTMQNVGYFEKTMSKIKTLCFTHWIFQKTKKFVLQIDHLEPDDDQFVTNV